MAASICAYPHVARHDALGVHRQAQAPAPSTMTDSTNKYWDRAQRYLAGGQITAARFSLESLLQRHPGHVPAMLILVGIALTEHRVRAATELALTAAGRLPEDIGLIADIAHALVQVGETVAARACLDHPMVAASRNAVELARLAKLRQSLGEDAKALVLLDRADAEGLDSAQFRLERGQELIIAGRLPEGEAELLASWRLRPRHGLTALELARLREQTPQDNHVADLRLRLQQVQHGSEDHSALLFALYKELEDIGQYDEAWEALAQANALMFARQKHDPEIAWRQFDSLIARCTAEFLQPSPTRHGGPQPIFIIGMPRSGTTLLERVLSNHSQVASAGELSDFGLQLRWCVDHGRTLDEEVIQRLPALDYAELGRRYLERTQWRAHGRAFFVDKMPRNWMVAGLIHRALPQARILNLVRDPMDVCFSNYRTWVMGEAFPWNYDIHALAAHYLQYRRVMDHWHAAMPGRILDVPYAELTGDPQATARKVFDFCGLAWEPGCIDITRNKATVATLSAAQVREPIHQRFFGEWRRYERQLQPLLEAIRSVR